MARCPFIPQDPDIDRNSVTQPPIRVNAVVMHDTIGMYTGDDSGDSQYIENHKLAHIVIGEDRGEWEQLLDTEVFAAHCNGANYKSFGIEFSRTYAGQPLTEWQIECLGRIIKWAHDVHGVPKLYMRPEVTPDASIHVNNGGFRGWISHASVRTDDGSAQHWDWIRSEDWDAALGVDEDMSWKDWSYEEKVDFADFIQKQFLNALTGMPVDKALKFGDWLQEQVQHAINKALADKE